MHALGNLQQELRLLEASQVVTAVQLSQREDDLHALQLSTLQGATVVQQMSSCRPVVDGKSLHALRLARIGHALYIVWLPDSRMSAHAAQQLPGASHASSVVPYQSCANSIGHAVDARLPVSTQP